MSNQRWRSENREGMGASSSPKSHGPLPQSAARTQVKGHGRGMHGKSKGWELGPSTNPWPSGGPKKKMPETPKGGSHPNKSNHGKKQGWAL